ncbi:MAG: Gfo/Idh/MocA family protein [Planctomycetota bacterium]|jgi:predicted dehydrogenase
MKDSNRRDFLKGMAGTAAAFSIQPGLAGIEFDPGAAPARIALIGSGRQGRAVLGELAKIEAARVVAICDVDPGRLRSSKRRAPEAADFADHAKLLTEVEDLDAVIVATPTHTHKQVALDAMAAGKHVYCESPLAHSVDDAQSIADAARQSDRVFQTGMQGRSNPIYKLARSFVRSGAIGDIVSMQAQWHKKMSWRSPASDPQREKALNWKLDPELSTGLAGEFGSQQIDVLSWFTGKYPVSVTGRGGILGWPDGRAVADTIHCELAYPKGLAMSYQATLCNSFAGQHELLVGTMGTVKLAWTAGWMFKEADASTQGWEVYANREQFHNDEGITLIADATKLAKLGQLKEGLGLPHPPLYYALGDFLKSVTEKEPVVCTADDGMRAVVIGILANQAIVSGEGKVIDPELFIGR